MVGVGSVLALLGMLFWLLRWRRPALIDSHTFLTAVALATPLGFVAVEAGWTVTEVGRQPWIIYGFMRTRDAVSPMPGLTVSLSVIAIVYLILSAVVSFVMWRLIAATEAHALPEGLAADG
jgi:cytochrome d ubiquinol oxidase subunit I